MPVHKTLKSRKLRGHVSHGHGRVGKHRKHSGGAGKAGGLKHLKTLFQKYHPDHFGKVGMNFFHRKKNANTFETITLNKVCQFVGKDLKERIEILKSGQMPTINFNELGISKVLGGELKYPVILIAKQFTESAKEEILRVGGKCVISA